MKCDELKAKSVTLDGEPNIYKKSDVDAAIAELKQKLHDAEMAKDDAEAANTEYRDDIRKLKAENEWWKQYASEQTEKLNVEKENVIQLERCWKETKRALWLARAKRAADRARIFYFCDMETELDIEGFSYDSQKKKGHKKLAARLWRIIWLKVERKCRSKAEEYK